MDGIQVSALNSGKDGAFYCKPGKAAMSLNSKRLILASAIFAAAVFSVNAQTQLPMDMVEELIFSQFNMPWEDFHRVFQAFAGEYYFGRRFLYQAELRDFAESFTYYILFNDLFTDPSPPGKPQEIFPATHRLTDNLRLRAGPSTSTGIITTLKSGTYVQVLEYGAYATIDNITAPWVQVKTGDGQTGWVFSGYLAPLSR